IFACSGVVTSMITPPINLSLKSFCIAAPPLHGRALQPAHAADRAYSARKYPDTFYRKKEKKTSQSLFRQVLPVRRSQPFRAAPVFILYMVTIVSFDGYHNLTCRWKKRVNIPVDQGGILCGQWLPQHLRLGCQKGPYLF